MNTTYTLYYEGNEFGIIKKILGLNPDFTTWSVPYLLETQIPHLYNGNNYTDPAG